MARQWNEFAPLPVRLAFGGGFMYHGYPKLFTEDGYQNIVHIMSQITNTPPPWLLGYIVGALEFFGGLALVTGAFVGTVSFIFMVEMIGNILMQIVRGGRPTPLNPAQPLPDIESSVLYLAASIALVIAGAGGCSLTRMFMPRPSD